MPRWQCLCQRGIKLAGIMNIIHENIGQPSDGNGADEVRIQIDPNPTRLTK